jgi:predicted RNA binding protein YcfA (HicA-like mRNA interferase family)
VWGIAVPIFWAVLSLVPSKRQFCHGTHHFFLELNSPSPQSYFYAFLQSTRATQRLPRKVRQLIADLEQAGFVKRGGKGSHRNFTHPKGLWVTISGGAGDDARHYRLQIHTVHRLIKRGHLKSCPALRHKLISMT